MVIVDQLINGVSTIVPWGLLRVSIKVYTFARGLCELLCISLVQTINKRQMSILSIRHLIGFQRIITLGITMLIIVTCYSQDIESFKDATPVKITGGLSANTMLTSTTDPNNQRDPLFWQLQGNINFNFFGVIDAPLSVTLNSQKAAVNQPALPTRIGISPK